MQVSQVNDWLGRIVADRVPLWVRLGSIESMLLPGLARAKIRAPIFICGLARSGSTMLLEILASHESAASHRYRDFPFLFTPYWWNMIIRFNLRRDQARRERAHGDGILVGPESPEALEEMLWRAFFAEKLPGPGENYPAFEQFYYDHIRKLLALRRGSRYLAKNHYNSARMRYLHALFPDALFIVPVREPSRQVASLMRQHKRFSEAGRKDPRIPDYMARAGHFEFGLKRKPAPSADARRAADIESAWLGGEEARGWALHWDMTYAGILEQLDADPALKKNSLIVPFEQLCETPRGLLHQLFEHVHLSDRTGLANRWAETIREPLHHAKLLHDDEIALIKHITGKTARRFGYE